MEAVTFGVGRVPDVLVFKHSGRKIMADKTLPITGGCLCAEVRKTGLAA
jgi:hypothetical protein